MLRWQIHEVLSELHPVKAADPERTLTYLWSYIRCSEEIDLLIYWTVQVKALCDLLVVLEAVDDPAEYAIACAR